MYEFTNGIVVFDEKTRDRYIEAGYKLKIESKTIESQHIPVGLVQFENKEEVENENTSNNGTIKKQSKKCNKLSK